MQDPDLTAHSEKPIYRPIKKKYFTILKLVEPKRSRKHISIILISSIFVELQLKAFLVLQTAKGLNSLLFVNLSIFLIKREFQNPKKSNLFYPTKRSIRAISIIIQSQQSQFRSHSRLSTSPSRLKIAKTNFKLNLKRISNRQAHLFQVLI